MQNSNADYITNVVTDTTTNIQFTNGKTVNWLWYDGESGTSATCASSSVSAMGSWDLSASQC